QTKWRSKLKLMLGINLQKQRVEALESMARSSARLASSLEQIATAEREKSGFLRWLFSPRRQDESKSASQHRRYGDDGGLKGGAIPYPNAPVSPGGSPALTGERPCINVTPPKEP